MSPAVLSLAQQPRPLRCMIRCARRNHLSIPGVPKLLAFVDDQMLLLLLLLLQPCCCFLLYITQQRLSPSCSHA